MGELGDAGTGSLGDHRDFEASPATKQEWRFRRRRRRLGAAGRLGAPLAVIVVSEALLVNPHGNLGHRAAIAVRPALLIIAVVVPLGWLTVALVAAGVRGRDRLRPLAPAERFAGRVVLQVDARRGGGEAGPATTGAHWAVGDLTLVDGEQHHGCSLHWTPTESSRSRGFQPFSIPAADVSGAEMELDRPHYGYARILLAPEGFVDFGVVDLPRLVDALTRCALIKG